MDEQHDQTMKRFLSVLVWMIHSDSYSCNFCYNSNYLGYKHNYPEISSNPQPVAGRRDKKMDWHEQAIEVCHPFRGLPGSLQENKLQ